MNRLDQTQVCQTCGIAGHKVVARVAGLKLVQARLDYIHPLLPGKVCPVVPAPGLPVVPSKACPPPDPPALPEQDEYPPPPPPPIAWSVSK